MSTSFLPFLYPARLVQRPLRAPVVRQFLRSLHATAPAHSRRQPPSSSSSSSPAPRAARRRDPIPFELPPDIERDLLPDSERLEQNGDEEDYVDDSGHINLGGVGGADGTITPLERQAFRRIFREIAHRQQQEELDLEMYGYEGMGDDVEAGVDGDYVGEDVGGDDDIGIDAGDASSPEALRRQDDEQRSRINSILGEASDDQVLARENQRNLRRQGEEAAMYALEGADASVATDTSVLRSLGSLGGASAATPQVPPPPPADTKLNLQRNRVLSQFPPSLRSAAGKAFGIKDEVRARQVPGHVQEETVTEPVTETKRVTPAETPEETALPPPSPAVLARRKRQQKMELAMLSKKTDFALWQYMEEHVFSLVDELGIGKDKAKASASAPATEKKSRRISSKLAANGPLYPALLLHGQRLLDSHFRGGTTSPLALAVLPRVKALGLASYVLGASTPLYNHLLGIRWLRQGDATAVFALLSEMQRAGLPFDQGTLNLVKSIEWHVVPLAGGRAGTGTGLAAPSAAAQRESAFLVAALQHLPDLAAVARTAAYWRQVVERSVNWGRRA
ncbi:uncharacterized protein SPSK_01641 [Sporothrix schenckii 1099-18]|uniref:Mtf2-like C-terminal domain-containing protein n=1 Tax=Sporothrix schenckii 1099-18 TaxID=1397361 RepID=A0A0F2MFE0_SPOSC|nr:uncharacterized protein SPSK_01641 [Sporothrix schenckii 1099-18]KJR87545.1 hypothetical protein SPSK_01641 [Sporothrix schenckii 1099-18]